MSALYILDDEGRVRPASDTITWAKWFETHPRHVADETVGESRVSTVFLGIDHGFAPANG